MSAAPPLFLLFRPMVAVAGADDAAAAAREVRARVAGTPGVERVEMAEAARPYWKIDGVWEFTLHVHPARSLADVFASLLAFAPGGGWTGTLPGDEGACDSDLWAVWNPPDREGAEGAEPGERSQGDALLLPAVVWAELCTGDGVAYDGPFEDADR